MAADDPWYHCARTPRLRRLTVIAVAVALGASLLAAAFFAAQAMSAVLTLQRGVERLEQATAELGDPLSTSGGSRLGAAAAMEREAAADIASATASLRWNPGLEASALVPPAAAQRSAAVDLAESAGDAAAAVGDLIEVGRQARALHGSGAPPGAEVVRLLTGARPALQDARRHLDAALARLARDRGADLVPPIGRELTAAIERLGSAQSTVSAATAAAAYLPGLLGADGSRTYLLLFPNPYELRPTGGLVGSVGTLTVDRGAVSGFSVVGYQTINSEQRQLFPLPPALARRMSFANDSLDIGDAGWDPDFPTSAALSERIYRSATGRQVDGTISIDPYAIAALLQLTGPIAVPPYGTFTAADFFDRLNAIVNVDRGPDGGKQALGPVARVLLTKLLAAPPSLWLRMAEMLGQQAQGGHVILWLHDPRAAAAAQAAHLDGSLVQVPDGEDYAMVVDANVGGTKGDAIVRKSAALRVEVGAGGLARHELDVTYAYPPGVVDPSVPAGADPAYRDDVRFYLPVESTVTGFAESGGASTGAIEDLTVEHGKRVVGTFFRAAPGQTVVLRLLYETPLAPGRTYRLYVQKQAGIESRPLDLLVSVPGGVRSRRLAGVHDEEVTITW